MVPRNGSWLREPALPPVLPAWLTDADIDLYAGEFKRTGFRGPLNYYRNLDRNWELMVPYARALSEHLRLPVFSIYSFVTWFQAGLAPRDFGPPGSVLR